MWNVPNKIEIELQLYSVKMLLLLEYTPQRFKNVFRAYEIEKSLRKESKRMTSGETDWLLRRRDGTWKRGMAECLQRRSTYMVQPKEAAPT